eukprot:6317584-Prymnesium_polylepis.3
MFAVSQYTERSSVRAIIFYEVEDAPAAGSRLAGKRAVRPVPRADDSSDEEAAQPQKRTRRPRQRPRRNVASKQWQKEIAPARRAHSTVLKT